MRQKRSAAPVVNDKNGTQSNSKDKHFVTQTQRAYDFFLTHTTTMFDAERQTGICRPNYCRYLREMEDRGLVQRIRKGFCPVSGFRAWFFTADRAQFKLVNGSQQTLFDQA